jgi:hypothetical protein
LKLVKYTNGHFEEEKALVDLDSKRIIMKGDYYHDKIDYLIDGYLAALNEHDVYVDELLEEEITSDHEMYNELDFYNEEEE